MPYPHTLPCWLRPSVVLLLYDSWPILEKNFSVVYLLQELGMYGLLAFRVRALLAYRRGGTVHAAGGQTPRTVERGRTPLHPAGDARLDALLRAQWGWSLSFCISWRLAPCGRHSSTSWQRPLIVAMFAAEYAVRAPRPAADRASRHLGDHAGLLREPLAPWSSSPCCRIAPPPRWWLTAAAAPSPRGSSSPTRTVSRRRCPPVGTCSTPASIVIDSRWDSRPA